jgi:hypothetical protein
MRRGVSPVPASTWKPRGGAAAGSGDPVRAVAADHGQQISAVGVGAADQPGGGAHVEEARPFRVGLDRQLGAQAGHFGDDAQALQQFALVEGVVGHHLRHVGQHLLDEPPGFERFRTPIVANRLHGET